MEQRLTTLGISDKFILNEISLNLITLLRHDGRTSLIEAAGRGYDKIVDLLLKSGAKVDAVDK